MYQSEELLRAELKRININPTTDQYAKLLVFIKYLLTMNQTLNLTNITNFQEALLKHIFDSLVIYNFPEFQTARSILDLGSGAGIPGIPLAICSPEKLVVGLDATRKKIDFQGEAIKEISINNYQPLWGRAETIGRQPEHRQKYDLVTARAVATAATLAELTLPLVRINGHVLFYKGPEYQTELDQAAAALTNLGGCLVRTVTFELPDNLGKRAIIIIKKAKNTPDAYPRHPGTPQKKPLTNATIKNS